MRLRSNLDLHLLGNAYNSLIDGISTHHSLSRMIAIHSVHNLLIRNCVGYKN